jgi:hypothetical protein
MVATSELRDGRRAAVLGTMSAKQGDVGRAVLAGALVRTTPSFGSGLRGANGS